MITIIAEKPSVAREIAVIVNAAQKNDGYLSGNGYAVTWAFGHLITLAMPEQYGFTGFNKENLPIVPNPFQLIAKQTKSDKGYIPDPGVAKQLNIIKELFTKSDSIIVATDAGREGELIFRYIYHYLSCKKPFERLWISSLTDKAIKEGLQHLKKGSDYDNLYYAAKARSEADWLVGINSSQALCIAAGNGVYSLGRVQTPTLAMICKRWLENKDFIPVPYWQVNLQTEKNTVAFSATSKEKFDSKTKADEVYQLLQLSKSVHVKSVEEKEVNQEPPLLYDLTTLQKEANSKHSFSADKTLNIAQQLYEAKLITYPRTGSRFISEDVYEQIPELIKSLEQHQRFGTYASEMSPQALNNKSVNDKKVTDHHALLITENLAKNLSGDDKIIYEMVAGRMLEAFSPKCVKDAVTIIVNCNDQLFEAKGSVVKIAGWRNVFKETEDNEEEQNNLPTVAEGEQLPVLQAQVLEKQTKPKPLHTEASLLSAMESCGKEVKNEDERAAMKDAGIGTPATRAAIIETLFSRDYIKRDKKSLVPTEKGLAVFDAVKNKKIADVSLTGGWENALAKIESGEMQANSFGKAIEIFTGQIVSELLLTKLSIPDQNACTCPKCKSGKMRFYFKVVKCDNETCSLTIFKNKAEKSLTDAQITELMKKGQTGIIKGFRSKAGKTFDAALKFDETFNTTFFFPEVKGHFKKKGK